MRHDSCRACGQTFPLNSLHQVLGELHCEACGNQALAAHGEPLQPGDVVRQVDPTVCGWCTTDFGHLELAPIVGVPTCDTCEQRMRNWPYPVWVKMALVSVLLVAMLAFVVNFRFFRAHVHSIQAQRAFQAADLERASALLGTASNLVPESRQFAFDADMVKALHLFSRDQEREALPLLERCQRSAPGDAMIKSLVLRAEASIAFDDKDYDRLLEKSREISESVPATAQGRATLASALACKYVITGQEAFKQQALAVLEEAKQLPGGVGSDADEYTNRILYRLETREIIDRDEFLRRFPNGWKKEPPAP